jgi:hypothetical protein
MRILAAVLIWVLLTTAAVAASYCREAIAKAPSRLGDMQLVQTRDLGGVYGVIMRYKAAKTRSATLYFYSADDGRPTSQMLDDELESAAETMARGRQIFTFGGDDNTLVLGRAAWSARSQGLANDFIGIGQVDRCIVKLRFSASGRPDLAGRDFVAAVQDLQRAFDTPPVNVDGSR